MSQSLPYPWPTRAGGLCGIGAGVLLVAGGVLTLVSVELDITEGLDLLITVHDHRTTWVLAAVTIAVAQPLLAPFLVSVWTWHPALGPAVATGSALVGAGAVLQLASAVVNVPLGAAVAGDAVAAGDPGLGTAMHDVADGLYFASNSLVGLGLWALSAGWPSGPVRWLAVVAATANLAVYLGLAVEALWPLGVIGFLAIAVVTISMGAQIAVTPKAPRGDP